MSDMQTHAQIAFGEDGHNGVENFDDPSGIDYDVHPADPAEPVAPAAGKRRKKGLPAWLLAFIGVFALTVVGGGGLVIYQRVKANAAAAAGDGVPMVQPAVPAQVPQIVTAHPPVPVAPAQAPLPPQTSIVPPPAAEPEPQLVAPAQAQAQPAQAQAPTQQAAMSAVASPQATAPDDAGRQSMLAQQMQEVQRDRAEILKRLNALEKGLSDLQQANRSQGDGKPQASKAEPKASAKKEAQVKRASAKEADTDGEEAQHKREVAAGVVHGVPKAVSKSAPATAKASEPLARRDYYVSGWIGNRAFYVKSNGQGQDSKEDSVVAGDTIDGMKVLSIDTRSRRIMLEGNQYIGFR